MERDGATTSYGEERGAGGKFRKPLSRKPPHTPYARPPDGGRRRWLSKLVNPACRLIASGANLILPSFSLFSKPDSADGDLPALDGNDHDKLVSDREQDTCCNDDNRTFKHEISGPTGVECSSRNEDKSKNDADEHRQDGKSDLSYDCRLSDIKKLVEGKRFSRDEINRLIEVINSRAVDDSTEQIKQRSSTAAGEETKDSPGGQTLSEGPEKGRDMNTSVWGTSTPLHRSSFRGEIGASPIDIAKAFMENRTSEGGSSSKSTVDEEGLPGDDFAGKPVLPSPLPKSAICWPGSMAKEQHGCLTPQTARSRSGLPRFPRTPYSRTVYSKSKSKFPEIQASSSQWQNVTSSPSPNFQTSKSRQVSLRSNALDDGKDSFGPIRRTRQKLVTERTSGGSSFFCHSPNKSPLVNISGFEGFTSNVEKTLKAGKVAGTFQCHSVDRGPHTCQAGAPTQSSQIARTILEHLERNPPTPKDKSAELKFAIESKKSPSSNVATVKSTEGKCLLPVRGFNAYNNMNQVMKNSGQLNEAKGNSSLVKEQCQNNSNEVADAVIKTTAASGISGESSREVDGKDSNPQNQSTQKDLSTNVLNAATSEILDQQSKLPSHFSGTKPVLPSIYISKPDPKWAFSSKNSSGFTFPVSTSTGVSSEPPTPSIVPISSVNGLHQPEENLVAPLYSFGSKRSSPALVFSFPSASSGALPDSSELKFNFGSDTKSRISFGSIGKDAVCY